MKTLKLILAVSALIFGTMAFAQDGQTEIYSSHGVLGMGACSLKVMKSGNQVDFEVPSQSKIIFPGLWPSEPGTVIMQGYLTQPPKSQFLGPEVEADASLKVTFAEVTIEGETVLQPRSFEYVDLEMEKSVGVITHSCSGLVRVK